MTRTSTTTKNLSINSLNKILNFSEPKICKNQQEFTFFKSIFNVYLNKHNNSTSKNRMITASIKTELKYLKLINYFSFKQIFETL